MNITTDFAAGKITKKNWVQVLGYKPESEAQEKNFGHMYGVISISSEIDFPLDTLGNFLLDELQRSYYEAEGTPGLGEFEQSLSKLKARLEEFLDREPELAEKGIDLELAVAVIKQDLLYAVVVGESKIYISRGEDFAEIGGALIDPDMEGFLRLGSLNLTAEDRVILTTSHIGTTNTEQNLAQAARGFDVKEIFSAKGVAILLGYELDKRTLDQLSALQVRREQDTVAEEVALAQQAVSTEVTNAPDLGDPVLEIDNSVEAVEVESEGSLDEKTEVGKGPGVVVSSLEEPEPTGDFIEDTFAYSEEPSTLKHKARNFAQKAGQQMVGVISSASGKVKEQIEKRTSAQKVRLADLGEAERVDDDELTLFEKVQFFVLDAIDFVKVQVKNLISGGTPDRKDIYLKGGKAGRNWRMIAVVALVIIGGLFLGIRQLIQNREREAHIREVETEVAGLSDRMDQLSVDVASLTIAVGQEERKQATVQSLDELKADAQALLEEEIAVAELEEIVDFSKRSSDQILNIRAFTEPQIVTDLGLNFEGADPVDITYTENSLYIVDAARGVIYRVATALASEAGVFAQGFTQPYAIDSDEDGDLVVVDQSTETSVISTINKTDGNAYRHPGLSKARIGSLADFEVWTNAAIYSLNPEKSAIGKQDNIGGNYQLPNDSSPWASDPQLAQGIDIAVDWWVYVLVKGQGLMRFLSGAPVSFTFVNLLPADQTAIANADAIEFTSTHFYIADSNNSRVLVFEKSLEDEEIFTFKEQYVYRGEGDVFKNIKDLVVNEAAKQIFVLDGSRVIRLDR